MTHPDTHNQSHNVKGQTSLQQSNLQIACLKLNSIQIAMKMKQESVKIEQTTV